MGEKLAIHGGTPVRSKPFQGWPVVGEEERRNLMEVLDSGSWYNGAKVQEFEEKYAAYQDAQFGVAVSSGTTSLETALVAAGVGAGDEVILPPYTFMASVSVILKVNAVPIFVDVEIDTFNLNPELIEPAITEKTAAIMPVHFSGLPCDMDRINEIALKHGVKVIEDACHAWGTKWKGKGAGALGLAGGFSFQMSKNIAAGDGGIVLTDDEEVFKQARGYANCGRGLDDPWFDRYELGTNYRMTEWQAAVLLAQLGRLQEQVETRQANGRYLDEHLGQIPGIRTLREDERCTQRSYHLYQARYLQEEFEGVPRERFFEAVRAEGVEAYGGYPAPLHKGMPLFSRKGAGPDFCPISCPYYGKDIDYQGLELPVSEQVCREAVWMRQSILLGSKEDMDDIITAFRKLRENVGQLG